MFDHLGNVLDGAGRDLLLESYFGEVDTQHRRDLDDLIAVYLGWNIAWTLLQIEVSEIRFDYGGFLQGLFDRLG